MNGEQLELEKILEYFDNQIFISKCCCSASEYGKEVAYRDAKEKCERLLEVVTSVYPESRLEDIQE